MTERRETIGWTRMNDAGYLQYSKQHFVKEGDLTLCGVWAPANAEVDAGEMCHDFCKACRRIADRLDREEEQAETESPKAYYIVVVQWNKNGPFGVEAGFFSKMEAIAESDDIEKRCQPECTGSPQAIKVIRTTSDQRSIDLEVSKLNADLLGAVPYGC